MEPVEWSAEISVGVARIDEEHKAFLDMLNGLGQAAAGEGLGRAAAVQAVERMREYALWHFKTEEEAMSASRYASRSSHVNEHDRFIEKVLDMEAALEEGQSVRAADIWRFLRGWLSEHILAQDKPLGEHLRACGIR